MTGHQLARAAGTLAAVTIIASCSLATLLEPGQAPPIRIQAAELGRVHADYARFQLRLELVGTRDEQAAELEASASLRVAVPGYTDPLERPVTLALGPSPARNELAVVRVRFDSPFDWFPSSPVTLSGLTVRNRHRHGPPVVYPWSVEEAQ